MKYLLDTSICIHIIRKKPEAILKKVAKFPVGDIGISSISVAELEVRCREKPATRAKPGCAGAVSSAAGDC